MEAESIPKWIKSGKLLPAELACNWCSAPVPLMADELCGVCINCGTVMFRDPLRPDRPAASAFERDTASGAESLPAPA